MDRAKDNGVGWRQYLKHELHDLGIHWLDPTRKPIDIGVEDDNSRALRAKAKQAGDLRAVREEMNPIRRVDLRMTDISDWIPVNIDLDIHACGTYEELFLANSQKKPVLVHIEQGLKSTPDWLTAALPLEHIFDTWDDMVTYVRHVAHDDVVDHMKRWYFFDFHGENT
jgi:hypothetical protein